MAYKFSDDQQANEKLLQSALIEFQHSSHTTNTEDIHRITYKIWSECDRDVTRATSVFGELRRTVPALDAHIVFAMEFLGKLATKPKTRDMRAGNDAKRSKPSNKATENYGFTVERPERSEFNATETNREALEQELDQLDPSFSVGDKVQLFGSLIVGALIIPFLASAEGRFEFWMLIGGPLIAALFCFPFGFLVKWQTGQINKSKERITYLREQIANIRQFEAAVLDWEHRRRISQTTYWKSLRGIDLEKGLKTLLEIKEWKVKLTKKVGDAGIDLICEKGNLKILVQCKGHKSPLSVSAIRDAAGVKLANNPDAMVVVAPNGFTKGSIQFALKADIKLVDASYLNKMVNNQTDLV